MDDPLPKTGTLWRNKKKGTLYRVVGRSFDATNATEGEINIRYVSVDGMPAELAEFGCDDFGRKAMEFMEKFEPVDTKI